MSKFACRLLAAAAFTLPLATIGCKNAWINARVENQSGETIHQLEVDYPSASFGADSLAPGATMLYKLQVRGNGPIKVEYTIGNGHIAHAKGPNLSDGQQGRLTIHLLPQGKTEFEAKVEPAS